jgi:phosphoadenosine phosphosulfate reductase
MDRTLNILSAQDHAAQAESRNVLRLANDADPLEAVLEGIERIERRAEGRQGPGRRVAPVRALPRVLPGRHRGEPAALREGRAMSAIELHARASKDFEAKLAETKALLVRAAAEFSPVTQASSLGAEDVVITHLINSLALDIEVFVLDTGMLHQQTLDLLERTRANSRAPVTVYRPVNESVIQFVKREGKEAMYKSIELRKACCHIRKMEPLGRALAGKRAWITGLRREQSNARADVPLLDAADEAKTGRVKFNPLANWTWGDVWHYVQRHQVDYNPLHDEFYPSIGCAPCTRAISLGEDFRAGRWWWEDEAAKECGLHVKTVPQAEAEREEKEEIA